MSLAQYEESEDPFNNDPDMPSDFDLMEYVANLQENDENSVTTMQSTQMATTFTNEGGTMTTSLQKTIKKSPNMPIFNNCKIGSITININK